jgi:parallel beta-helix repeat protein
VLFIKQLALFCLLALWAVGAEAATYYVRTDGRDSHSCIKAQTDDNAHAKRTIQAGVNCLSSAGDTLIIHGGTYNENVLTPKNLTGASWNTPVTIKAAPGESVTVYGYFGIADGNRYVVVDGFVVDAHDASHTAMYTDLADHIRFQNMEWKNARHSGFQGCGNPSPGFCEFINLRVHSNGKGPNTACNSQAKGGQCHGIYIHGSNLLFDGVESHDNAGIGIHLSYTTSNNTIRNSKIYNNEIAGIGIAWGKGGFLLYNNIIYNNGSGISLHNAGSSRIYNNITYGNSGNGIRLEGSGYSVKNNIAYNNDGDIEDLSGNTLSDNLTSNPSFVNAPGESRH